MRINKHDKRKDKEQGRNRERRGKEKAMTYGVKRRREKSTVVTRDESQH